MRIAGYLFLGPLRAICVSVISGMLFLAPVAQAVNPPSVQYGPSSFVNYETPHVHPLDETPDGKFLLAVNTAEGSLLAFNLESGNLHLQDVIMVGLDPVSVRARTATEWWVVNSISNNISVVDLHAQAVVASIDVCHSPGDVVFAGSPRKAIVSCTRPNRLVMVDPTSRTVVGSINIAGESPRALATSADGATVYAAIFESGTPTTILVGDTNDPRINNVTQYAGGPWGGVSPVPNNGKTYNPPINPANPPPPPVSTIVYKTGDGFFQGSTPCSTAIFGRPVTGQARNCWSQDPSTQTWTICAQEGGTCSFTGLRRVIFGAGGYTSSGRWQDDINGDWTSIVTGDLSAISNRVVHWDLPDRDVAILNVASGKVTYQTRLMNAVMAISVNPSNGQVYVVGTDATNSIRFQPVLNGKFLRVNLARFTPGKSPAVVDLNPHLNYATSTVPLEQRLHSIGDPRGIAWTSDGRRGYITGMGSNSVVVVNRSGARCASVTVGKGPTGVVVDDARGQLYVMNKFDASISVMRISDSAVLGAVSFFDPTPSSITGGRKFFYDTHLGSGNGHIACASCHIDAKTDRLAWDLGDPSGVMTMRNGYTFHPMRGAMVTQTLQNMIGSPSLHHQGDRADIFAFAPSLRDLQGADAPLDLPSTTQLQAFLASVAFPPNPNRNPDNTLGSAVPLPGPLGTVRAYADANTGMQQFNQPGSCSLCHVGSMGRSDTQGTNVLHLSQVAAPESMQGLYQRLGMFWLSADGSTVGTGIRTNGAHDSTFANENTSNEMVAYMLSFEGPREGQPERSANSHAGIGLQTILTPAGATQQNGTFCANENAICSFTGTREVIFGADGIWRSGVFTGSARCNTVTFGDPVPGVTKTCAVRAGALVKCAAENGICAFDPLSEVFFGSGNSVASSLVLRKNTACSTAIFSDPAPGVAKSCYVRPASEFARVNYMLGIAETGRVGLVANGVVYGLFRGAYYLGGGLFQTDILTGIASLRDIYVAVKSGSRVQLTLVPRGAEYRIGVDANVDGRLNADQFIAHLNPRDPSLGSWRPCASESAKCIFSGLKVVRFGVPGSYAYGVFNNSVSCTTSIFGDPLSSLPRTCSVAN